MNDAMREYIENHRSTERTAPTFWERLKSRFARDKGTPVESVAHLVSLMNASL